jgi:hypothetical protein
MGTSQIYKKKKNKGRPEMKKKKKKLDQNTQMGIRKN